MALVCEVAHKDLHWVISECHSHPLGFFVAFENNQHQGSLPSVTSPSANQQPVFHDSTSREVDLDWSAVFRCTPANTWESVQAVIVIQARGYPRVFHFQFIIYLFIIILMEFLKVWTKHIFYYIQYYIIQCMIHTYIYHTVYTQPRYFHCIFKSVHDNNMNWVILHSVRPPFWKMFFSTHLDAAVQTVAVKALTPGGDYQLVGGWIPVSVQTLVKRVKQRPGMKMMLANNSQRVAIIKLRPHQTPRSKSGPTKSSAACENPVFWGCWLSMEGSFLRHLPLLAIVIGHRATPNGAAKDKLFPAFISRRGAACSVALPWWHRKALTQWPPFFNVIVLIYQKLTPAENGLVFVGTWNIRLNFMASEFFARQRACRFYTAGCGNKMAVSVTGPCAANELGGPVIQGSVAPAMINSTVYLSFRRCTL